MYPRIANPYDKAICQNRSPVRSECQELISANMVANAQGGKVSSNVMVVLKPKVCVMEGKYAPNERPVRYMKYMNLQPNFSQSI